MTARPRPRYPTQAAIKRQAAALQAAGLEIAGVDTFPDGRIRFDTRATTRLSGPGLEDADGALAEFEAGLEATGRA